MKTTQSLKYAALAIACIAAGVLIGNKITDHRVAEFAPKIQAEEKRKADGPYIAFTKQIGQSESIKKVIIPGDSLDFFDRWCMIYTNTDANLVSMSCPVDEHLPPQ